MRRPGVTLIALALALTPAIAACGDDDDGAADGTTTSTSAPSGSSTSSTDPKVREDCSAALADAPTPDPDLPAAVAETRADILEAALACDYDGLAAVAEAGDSQFTATFGGTDDPADFWRRLEAEGDPVMQTLVDLLAMPWRERDAGDATQFVWPAAYAYDTWAQVPEGEREQLEAIYSEDEIAQFARAGSYLGWRVGITADGDWLFFVEGD